MRGLYDSANIDEMSSSGNKIIKYLLGVKILREKFQPKCHYVEKKIGKYDANNFSLAPRWAHRDFLTGTTNSTVWHVGWKTWTKNWKPGLECIPFRPMLHLFLYSPCVCEQVDYGLSACIDILRNVFENRRHVQDSNILSLIFWLLLQPVVRWSDVGA